LPASPPEPHACAKVCFELPCVALADAWNAVAGGFLGQLLDATLVPMQHDLSEVVYRDKGHSMLRDLFREQELAYLRKLIYEEKELRVRVMSVARA
jgi:hypothetical protein